MQAITTTVRGPLQYAAFRVTDYEAAESHIHLIDLETGEETRFYTFPEP
jgi:hypothetical protein